MNARYPVLASAMVCLLLTASSVQSQTCPEYFEANVSVGRRAADNLILSNASTTYYNRWGNVSSETYTYGHYIEEEGKSVVVNTDDIQGSYSGAVSTQGHYTLCYRGLLITVVGCASITIRSNETCVPEMNSEEGGGIPGTQPGDGTGDGPVRQS